MEILVITSVILVLGMLVYQIQKRIGEDQARDWKAFKEANPQYFKKPEPPVSSVDKNIEQKKSL